MGKLVLTATFIASLLMGTALLSEVVHAKIEDDYLRLQVEADFDRDGDIDFLDFTVFSALYEGE